MFGSDSDTATSSMRPPMLAGPIERNRKLCSSGSEDLLIIGGAARRRAPLLRLGPHGEHGNGERGERQRRNAGAPEVLGDEAHSAAQFFSAGGSCQGFILPQMRTIRRVTTSFLVLLTVASLSAMQDKQAEYDDHMREAEQMIARRMWENALQTYKKAYALKDKQSLDAAFGMALAYRGLGAYKNVVDLMGDAMKLPATTRSSRRRS